LTGSTSSVSDDLPPTSVVPPPVATASGSTIVVPAAFGSTETPSSVAPAATVSYTSAALMTSKGFWANSSAVRATFIIVTLVVLGLLFAFIRVVRRKRRVRPRDDAGSYFEKYTPRTPTVDGGGEDLEPNSAEVMTPAATNAYPDRGIHYGSEDVYTPSDYGIEYPPGAEYNGQEYNDAAYAYGACQVLSEPPNLTQSHASASSFMPLHPYADPQNSSSMTGLAPPVTYRDSSSRASGYPQSVDSFYGAAGSPR